VNAVVRQLRRTTTVASQPGNLVTDNPTVTDGKLGGDCLCGRGQTIGTCHVTDTRMWFRAFHEEPAVYHLQNVTDWACVDCVADAALDVANGAIRDRMRKAARERAAEIDALARTNEMRRETGLPIVPFLPGNEV
jgi:hypothetical protein